MASKSVQFAEPGSFVGQTIIVTGGAGAIGRPLCHAFAAAGAQVVVNDLGGGPDGGGSANSKPADAVVAEIKALGGSAIADYHSVEDGAQIVEAALAAFGRVDAIVNNAGIIRYKALQDHTVEDFRRLLEVNTLGGISLVLAAWPHFVKQDYGRVINFTSDSIFGMPSSASYIVSKSALVGCTRAFAYEGAKLGITVNAVAPVAYSRMAGDTIPDADQRAAFKAAYLGEGNVPMVLALAHKSNTISGKIFSLGAFNVSELVLGFKDGFPEGTTMEACLENRDVILGAGKKIQEAANLDEMMAKRMGFEMQL